MTNVIPELLNDFRIYLNGSVDAKGVADLQLPALEPLTETVSGTGIAGEYEAVVLGQFKSMKFTINWSMLYEELIEFMKPTAVRIDCRLANQMYDTANSTQVIKASRVLINGTATKNELGKVAKGKPYEASTELEVTYLKVELFGKTIIELDKLNYIYIVDGVDYLKQIREALGL